LRQRAPPIWRDAFVAYLSEVVETSGGPPPAVEAPPSTGAPAPQAQAARLSLQRLIAYAFRESLELRRDRLRLTFALAGSVLLMFFLGYGITLDVEDLPFAVLDRDGTPESRDYARNISGSRYFIQRPPLENDEEMDQALRAGRVALALEFPPKFGQDLRAGRQPDVSTWVDGAMPFRAETARGYAEAMHQLYVGDLFQRTGGQQPELPAKLEIRYRYNQDVRSIEAMVPAVIPLLLIFIPALLSALSVVREKELGSITNLYVTPTTRLEFLMGKQLPYIAVAMFSLLALVVEALILFRVPIKGSLLAFAILGLLYVCGTTGIGLVVSTFTRTQVAALAATSILTLIPTSQFSGLTTPASSLEGVTAWISKFWPATYFITASRGIFSKALGLWI
jgi:ribosome-dependent ATPase